MPLRGPDGTRVGAGRDPGHLPGCVTQSRVGSAVGRLPAAKADLGQGLREIPGRLVPRFAARVCAGGPSALPVTRVRAAAARDRPEARGVVKVRDARRRLERGVFSGR